MVPILLIILPLAGLFLGWSARYFYALATLKSVEQQAVRKRSEAEKDAESIKKQARIDMKEELSKQRSELEREYREERRELQQVERRLQKREESLSSYKDLLDREGQEIKKRQESISKKEEEITELITQQHLELEKVAGLTRIEAHDEIVASIEKEARKHALKIVDKIELEARQEGEKRAREIVLSAIQRIATESTTESTVFSIQLPSDDIKGKIIGREGRNIRSLETLTGVDAIIDDTPETVVISCFDPVRRTVAAQSLDRLIKDGRIHPGRIEETVKRVQLEINATMREEAEKVVQKLGLSFKPEVINTLGRLFFRTSYGQNMLRHVEETAMIASLIAGELGADRELAKRAALLHDIGKAVPSDVGMTHVEVGVALAKHWGESTSVINAIEAHHGDVEPLSIEAVIVQLSDAISASRPGARREVVGTYIQRLESFERIAKGFDGVTQSFAIQGGRELRVIVNQEELSDDDAMEVARGIAQQIEDEMNYPGRIKVTVIRETRIIEYAC